MRRGAACIRSEGGGGRGAQALTEGGREASRQVAQGVGHGISKNGKGEGPWGVLLPGCTSNPSASETDIPLPPSERPPY